MIILHHSTAALCESSIIFQFRLTLVVLSGFYCHPVERVETSRCQNTDTVNVTLCTQRQ